MKSEILRIILSIMKNLSDKVLAPFKTLNFGGISKNDLTIIVLAKLLLVAFIFICFCFISLCFAPWIQNNNIVLAFGALISGARLFIALPILFLAVLIRLVDKRFKPAILLIILTIILAGSFDMTNNPSRLTVFFPLAVPDKVALSATKAKSNDGHGGASAIVHTPSTDYNMTLEQFTPIASDANQETKDLSWATWVESLCPQPENGHAQLEKFFNSRNGHVYKISEYAQKCDEIGVPSPLLHDLVNKPIESCGIDTTKQLAQELNRIVPEIKARNISSAYRNADT